MDDESDGDLNRLHNDFWSNRQKQIENAMASPAVAEEIRRKTQLEVENTSRSIPRELYVRSISDPGTLALKAQEARRPNWEKWRYVPECHVWEGVALSLDIEPAKVLHHSANEGATEHLFNESPVFDDRLFIARRNAGGPALPLLEMPTRDLAGALVSLSQFVAWAKSIGWSVPEQLSEFAIAESVVSAPSVITPPEQIPKSVGQAPSWIIAIQTEAAARWHRYRSSGANPTKNNLKDELARWARENDIKTTGGINPSADYIARHALRTWTPPGD